MRPRKAERLSWFVTTLMVALATVTYFYTSIQGRKALLYDRMRMDTAAYVIRNQDLASKFDNLQKEINRFSEIANQSANGSSSSKEIALLQADMAKTEADLSSLRSSVDALNVALLNTPEKAIALPLLRKDLDDFKDETLHQIDSVRGEMTRSYDVNRWLIGLILAAVVGIVLNNVLQPKVSSRKSPQFE